MVNENGNNVDNREIPDERSSPPLGSTGGSASVAPETGSNEVQKPKVKKPSKIKWFFGRVWSQFWGKKESGTFYSYSDFIFFIPLIIAGFLLRPIVNWEWINPETAIWIWIGCFFYGILAGSAKPGPIACGFIFVGFLMLFFAAKYFESSAGFLGLQQLYHHFADKDLLFDEMVSGLVLTLCEFLSFMFLCTYVWTRLDKKHIASNQTVKRDIFWGGYRVIVSETRNVDSRYPNLLGALILVGTVIIEKNGVIVAEVDNVPFLPFRIRGIQRSIEVLLTKTVDK